MASDVFSRNAFGGGVAGYPPVQTQGAAHAAAKFVVVARAVHEEPDREVVRAADAHAVRTSSDTVSPEARISAFRVKVLSLTILVGMDDCILEGVAAGARGWIAGLVNAFPEENRLLWDLSQAGRWEEARDVYRWYMPLLHLDVAVKLVQYIKLAVQESGLGSEWVRAPRLPITGAERRQVLKWPQGS